MVMNMVTQSSKGNKHSEFSEILHELNQPLTAIGNYAQAGSTLLANGSQDSERLNERLKELFDKIAEQSTRSFEISRKLHRLDLPTIPSSSS